MIQYNTFNYQEQFEIFLKKEQTKSFAAKENKINQLIVFRNTKNTQTVTVDENEWLNLRQQVNQLFETNCYRDSAVLGFNDESDNSLSSDYMRKAIIQATTQKGYLNVFQNEEVLISLDEAQTDTENNSVMQVSIIKNMKVVASFEQKEWEDIKNKVNDLYLQ